uniref:Uncharacterized protein n=1 Tax=Arion vulgaris TaxID=1028688 RepID=A0A0B7BVQ9_9EUPU
MLGLRQHWNAKLEVSSSKLDHFYRDEQQVLSCKQSGDCHWLGIANQTKDCNLAVN